MPVMDGELGLAPAAPRLPGRLAHGRASGVASFLFHMTTAALVVAILPAGRATRHPGAVQSAPASVTRTVVFLQTPGPGGGGGGGGRRNPRPASRGQAPGRARTTVATGSTVPTAAVPPPLLVSVPRTPQLLLDVKPTASGSLWLPGVPEATASTDLSAGPGSGGGIGDGVGTGMGSGTGPGLGPGSGGGFGGGVYRIGSGVTAPVLVRQVKPKYTDAALQLRIQGTVALDAVVDRDGIPHVIRVAHSLEPGLDAEALAAARAWRFVPGRLGNTPVNVLVVILIDFHVH